MLAKIEGRCAANLGIILRSMLARRLVADVLLAILRARCAAIRAVLCSMPEGLEILKPSSLAAKQPCSQAALTAQPPYPRLFKEDFRIFDKKKVCRKPGTPGTRHPNQDYLKKVLTF
jgi:hypothetical protein